MNKISKFLLRNFLSNAILAYFAIVYVFTTIYNCHHQLFIVTLERFSNVSYKLFIHLFFNCRYRGITVISDPHQC